MLFIFLFLFTSVAWSQQIDCTLYQSQVDSTSQQFKNAQNELEKAEAALSECEKVSEVIKSPEYAKAVQAITFKNVGTNWNDMDVIK